jgi:hypothetical protein
LIELQTDAVSEGQLWKNYASDSCSWAPASTDSTSEQQKIIPADFAQVLVTQQESKQISDRVPLACTPSNLK